VPPPSETVATPGDTASSAAASAPAGPSEAEDQPVPWGWQSTGTDLPVGRRYNPAAYDRWSGNQIIVPPQEPPAQPQPVVLSAEARSGIESFASPGNAQVAVEPATLSAPATTQSSHFRIETDYPNLLLLAVSLEKLARDEIDRLSEQLPNDPHTIESNKKQCDLLSILADGFAKISEALVEYSKQPQPLLAGKAREIVDEVAAQLKAWWKKNACEATDWFVRIPILTIGITALRMAGADTSYATAILGALVGGPKVITAIRGAKRAKRQ
jgi:hypothetical protein